MIENDDTVNTTVTTLAQRLGDRFLDPMANGKFVLNGNGHEIREKVELNGRNTNWILDNFNTGYVCPPQDANIVFERSVQSAPSYKQVRPNPSRYSSNEFSKVYFDHGVSPSNAGYEYVMIPNSSEVETEALANRISGNVASRPYHVLAKNGKQHIVQFVDGGKDVWAMALFSADTTFPEDSLVLSNDINALVMYEKHGDGKVSISATNPDLGIKLRGFSASEVYTLNLKLSGNWSVFEGNPDVTVSLDGSETNLRFTLSDGLPEDIVLEPVEINETGLTVHEIGTDKLSGSAAGDSSNFELLASGSGFSGTSDSLTMVGREITGDFEVTVRVNSISGSQQYSSVALMARNTLNPASRYVAASVRQDATRAFEWRSGFGDDALNDKVFADRGFPTWLRLRRHENTLIAYSSRDGESWVRLGLHELAGSGDDLWVGLASSSKNNEVTIVSEVEDFEPLEGVKSHHTFWAKQHFTPFQQSRARFSAEDSDPDRDGFNNRLERLLGLDPMSADRGKIKLHRTRSEVGVMLPVSSEAVDLDVDVQWSRRLSGWRQDRLTERPVPASAAGGVSMRYFEHDFTPPELFFRVGAK